MNRVIKQLSCPNPLLRRQRQLRSWTQEDVAKELYRLCQHEPQANGRRGEINAKMIGSWERGDHIPNAYYQRQLCLLFEKSAEELGFLETTSAPEQLPVVLTSSIQQVPSAPLTSHQAIDFLREHSNATPEQQLGAWLAMSSQDLMPLFDANWTPEAVLEVLHTLLQGVQTMPSVLRRKLLQLGVAAVVSNIPVSMEKHASFEDRAQLQQALSDGLIAGFKLFHTAGNAQVLAVAQTQLYFVQQSHSSLSSRDRPMFYRSAYNLMGMALELQGRYEEALQAHTNAQIAARGTADPWNVSQSLICQANVHQALNQHTEAIQAIEEALLVIGNPANEEQVRAKAHLLGCWADNALTMGENDIAQQKLEAAATFLDQLHPHVEFDRASWFQLQGKHALAVGEYAIAIQHFDQALAQLPPNWIVRQILTLLPKVAAYAHLRDREASLATARTTASALGLLNAPELTRPFAACMRGLIEAFPKDAQVRTFVTDTLHHLPQSYG